MLILTKMMSANVRGRLLQNGASYGVGFSFFFMGVDFVKNDVQSIGI